MGIHRIAWLSAAALGACALAYVVVACVDNSNTVDPCPKYCSDMQATCTGTDQQYPNDTQNATCVRICGAINALDAGNNTIACRQLNVSSAKDELDPTQKHLDCVGAGVAAINCAVDQCTAFCQADLALCTGSNAAYPDLKSCTDACATWGQSFDGALIPSTGNTLQCRTYHLELSQSGSPADLQTHCAHTGATSAKCSATVADAGGGDAATESGAADAGTD